jgi:hypothetical protein
MGIITIGATHTMVTEDTARAIMMVTGTDITMVQDTITTVTITTRIIMGTVNPDPVTDQEVADQEAAGATVLLESVTNKQLRVAGLLITMQ